MVSNCTPLRQAIILIIGSLIVGAYRGLQGSFWAIGVIVLVFRRGIIVMLLYITSLASGNKLFKRNSQYLMLGVLLAGLVYTHVDVIEPNLKTYLSNNYRRRNLITITVISRYLILCLVCVAKYCHSFKGSLIKTKF